MRIAQRPNARSSRAIFGKLPCQDFVSVLHSELTVLGQFKANVLMHFWRAGVQMRSLFSTSGSRLTNRCRQQPLPLLVAIDL